MQKLLSKMISGNSGSIVMGVEIRKIHQNTLCIVMYFDVFQWAPITILPPLISGGGGGVTYAVNRIIDHCLLFFFRSAHH